jgi:hypothetical protein
MSNVANIAKLAARRRTWLRLARLLPLALAAGFAAAILLLAASRLAGIALPTALLVALPLLIVIVWCGLSLWRHRLSLHAAAAALDERANLHDQLAAALEFENNAAPDPFQTLTRRSAEALASEVSLASLLPLRWHRSTLLLPVAIGALIATFWLIPLRVPPSAQLAGVRTLPQDTAERAAASLEESQQIVESVQDTYPQVETADQTAALLDDLQEQLAAGEALDESDIARASNALEEAADELESRAQETRESFEDLQDSLAQLDRPESQDETSPLRDALTRGDYERAQEEIDRLLEELEMFNAEQSEEADSLRESLDQLQDDLESLSTPQEPSGESAEPLSTQDQSPDQSPSSDPSQPDEPDTNNPPPSQSDQTPPDSTPDQPQAQDESGEPETQPSNPPASEDEPSAQGESTPTETAPEPPQTQDEPGDSETQPRDPPADNAAPSQQDENSQSNPAGTQQENTTEQSSQDPSDTPSDQNQSQSDQTQQQQSQSPTNAQEQDSESQTAKERIEQLREALKRDQSSTPTSTDEQAEQQEQPERQPSSERDSSPQRDESDQPPQNEQPQEQQDQNPSDKPGSPQQVDKESLERAKELIQRWQEQQEQAQDAQGDAQKLREQAQDLLESMNEEQVEQFRNRSRDGADDDTSDTTPDGSNRGDGPAVDFQRDPLTTNTEPVDARQQGEASQVLAEWFPDRDQPRDERTTQNVATRLRQAAQSARRASDRRSLPPRSRDAVRRYFDRLDELASPKQAPTPPPAEDASPPPGDQ